MAALPEMDWTIERYLAYERESDLRHEYLNGEIFAMTGASLRHNLIAGSTYVTLYTQLRSGKCTVYPSDMRVKVSRTRLYTYPDISVVCGPPQLEDRIQDTLLNPILIVEVLSPSTESYDRGKKFQHYRTLESLQGYVLIAQDSIRVEYYARQADGRWLLADASGLDASLELPPIGCTLRLADVYEKISFEGDEVDQRHPNS